MFRVTGVTQAKKVLEKSRKDFIRKFANKIALSTQYVHHSVTDLTAVWSGKTLANWRWSVGAVDSSVREPVGGTGYKSYGHTSSMSLGSEPMRNANQAIADASFRMMKVDKDNPFQLYTLSNPWFVASLMEAGAAPDKNRARTAQMVRITKTGLVDYIRGIG